MAKKKMRILFDADPMTGSKTGVGYYTAELIKALAALDPENIEVVGHYFNFLGREKSQLPEAPNITYKRSSLLPRKIVNQLRRLGISVPFELLIKSRGDFIVFPSYLHRPSIFRTPFTTVVHDVTYLDHPEFVDNRNLNDLLKFMPDTLRKAAFVSTVSYASKKAIQKHYSSIDMDILVEHIPPVDSLKSTNNNQLLKKMGIRGKYILFVGTVEPRKNLETLLRAYEKVSKTQSKYSLVVAGGSGWKNSSIYSHITKMQKKGLNIILTGYVSDEVKFMLYKNASAVALPSFYEGYGMQLLEAASTHIPIVASDIEVFHEVIGDGALYFNPKDEDQIAETILKVTSDIDLRKELIKKQEKTLQRLSWNKLAKSFYEQILSHI